MKNIISAEICRKCGACCKNYPFVELSKNDINVLEEQTALNFDLFTNQKGREGEEYFLQFQENGDCFFLQGNDGSYFCGVYEARPGICKKYPSEPLQKKVCDAHMVKCLSAQGPNGTVPLTGAAQFFRQFVATCHLPSWVHVFTKWKQGSLSFGAKSRPSRLKR